MRQIVIPMSEDRKREVLKLREDAVKAREAVRDIHGAIEITLYEQVHQAGIAEDDPGSVKHCSLSEDSNYLIVDLYHPNEKRRTAVPNQR